MATTNILDLNNRVTELEKNKGSGGGGAADDVTYDNTASHLEATDVQGAIDELSGEIAGLSADDVSYDGTDSGLSAVTVQSAIDETVNKIDEVVTSIEQVNILSTLTIETGVNIDTAIQNGKMVTISGTSMPMAAAGIQQLFSTTVLPKSRTVGCIGFASSNDVGNGYIYIDSSGNVSIFFEKTTTYGIYFTINYLIR